MPGICGFFVMTGEGRTAQAADFKIIVIIYHQGGGVSREGRQLTIIREQLSIKRDGERQKPD
jgi:hypothetical protein